MEIERYQRVSPLGKGPMSIVWLARDTQTQEQVALKIMTVIATDDKRNQKASERFQREIDIAQSLDHPHILPLVDHGYMDYNGHHVPYLVTPYIGGGSLADIIENTPPWECWSLIQTADAISQAAYSLEYLHTRKPRIVHEDVKPANFLVKPIGESHRAVHLYLCDFGISRWQQPHMMASDVLGTLAFMAPEQAERRVMPASDQYALAVMACLMLTGKLPIQGGTNDELLYAHLNEPPSVPSELHPQRLNSQAVDDVFLTALDKDPERRYPSIAAFAQALEAAITEYVESEANATTQFLDSSTLPTSPLIDDEITAPLTDEDAAQFVNSEDGVVSSGLDDRKSLFLIDMITTDVAEQRILDEPLPEKPVKRTHVAAAMPHEVLRSLNLRDVARYPLPARPKFFDWSHNGEMLACVLYSHAPLYLSRHELVKGGQSGQGLRVASVSNASQATNLCWSPDNRVLAIAVRNEVRFWDIIANVELPLVITVSGRGIDGLSWSRRGQLALWSEATIFLYTLSPALLASRQPPIPSRLSTNGGRSGGTGGIGILRWSPDGTQLLAGTSNGSLFCWDVQRDTQWQPMHGGQKVNGVAWSDDGTWFIAALRNNEVRAWDVRAQRQVLQWSNLPAMPRSLSIGQDGCIVISSSEHALLGGLPGQDAPSMKLPGQLFASWSPDGEELVTLDELHEHVLVLWQ